MKKIRSSFFCFLKKMAIKLIFTKSFEQVAILKKKTAQIKVEWKNKSNKIENNLLLRILNHYLICKVNHSDPISYSSENFFIQYTVTNLSENNFLIIIRSLSDKEIENRYIEENGKIVHDLRSTIQTIMGLSELAVDFIDENKLEKAKEFLNNINKYAKNIADDVETYLDFYKAKNKKILDKNVFSFKKMAIDLKNIIEISFRDKKILVDVDIEGEEINIKANYSLLKNALINTLKNAAEASPPQEKVELKLKEDPQSIKIKIINLGYISEEDKEKFFSDKILPFSKNGHNLGTKIIKTIISAHNGQINVQNENGKVIVTITLPK